MKSESKRDSKQAVLGNVFQKCKSDRPKFTSLPTKNTPNSSQQTDLFESVRAFLLVATENENIGLKNDQNAENIRENSDRQ